MTSFSSLPCSLCETQYHTVPADVHNSSHFLNIVESTKKPDGTFDRHSIMVYEEDIENFMKELNRAFKVFRKQKPGNSFGE